LKAQTATEYLIIVAVLFLIVSIVLVIVYDVPGVLVSGEEVQNAAYWRNAPIGLIGVYGGNFNTTFYIINNHREPLTILNLSINNVYYFIDRNSSAVINPGSIEWFVIDAHGFESALHFFSFGYSIRNVSKEFTGAVPFRVR
jgi:hypothetical protein